MELEKVLRNRNERSQLVGYTGVSEEQQRGTAGGEGLEKRAEGAKVGGDRKLATG